MYVVVMMEVVPGESGDADDFTWNVHEVFGDFHSESEAVNWTNSVDALAALDPAPAKSEFKYIVIEMKDPHILLDRIRSQK